MRNNTATERFSRAIADLFDIGIHDGRVLVIRCTQQPEEQGFLWLEAQVVTLRVSRNFADVVCD